MSQTMKPQTVANKLGIHLPAAPEEIQHNPMTRAELDALRGDPPAWLVELRRDGPFPREVVAAKLGISRSGLARGGLSGGLTAEEVGVLLADPPPWLLAERRTQTAVLAEKAAQQETDRA